MLYIMALLTYLTGPRRRTLPQLAAKRTHYTSLDLRPVHGYRSAELDQSISS
jgi:hypothetical protein